MGGRPLLWHVTSTYRAQGFERFIFLTGHLGDQVASYVDSGELPEGGSYLALDTGEDTTTGGRVLSARNELGQETFCLTYVDGLSDIDLEAELAFHRAHGRLATVTAVQPPGRYGAIVHEGTHVLRFQEKPPGDGAWVNGGFFVLHPRALDTIDGDQTPWEADPLQRLAAQGQLEAWQHRGFWQAMDTLRDRQHLEQLWARGEAPWKCWT